MSNITALLFTAQWAGVIFILPFGVEAVSPYFVGFGIAALASMGINRIAFNRK